MFTEDDFFMIKLIVKGIIKIYMHRVLAIYMHGYAHRLARAQLTRAHPTPVGRESHEVTLYPRLTSICCLLIVTPETSFSGIILYIDGEMHM